MDGIVIFPSAHKWGVSAEDIHYILDHLLYEEEQNDDRWLLIGSDRDGNERALIVIVTDDGRRAVIHAKKPTAKERRHL